MRSQRSIRSAGPRRSTLAYVLAAILGLATLPLSPETQLFRSDEIGMPLEPIPAYRAVGLAWVLQVNTGPGNREVRRLLADGQERRRWEIDRSADGKREEREYDSSGLVARRLFAKEGELLREELFAEGKPAGRTVYQYVEGRLARATSYAADGSVEASTEYLLTSSGRLREVRMIAPQGERQSAAQVMGRQRTGPAAAELGAAASLAEDRTRVGEQATVARYDASGRVVARETREAGSVVTRESISYQGDERTPSTSSTEWPSARKVLEVTYGAGGVEAAERTSVAGTVVESITWQRDGEGRALVKRRTSAKGAEEWRYAYAGGGALERTEYLARGALVSITSYSEADKRTEEFYADGQPFLRVQWVGEKRTKEEVILDGKVVRERTFE